MKEWLDCPVSNMRQHVEHDYWCPRCKERYCVRLQLDHETGEYWGDEACPLCGHDGILASEQDDNVVE